TSSPAAEAQRQHRLRRRLPAVGCRGETCRASALVWWASFSGQIFTILVIPSAASPPCWDQLPRLLLSESFTPWAGVVPTHLGTSSCIPSSMTQPPTLGQLSQPLILTIR